MYARTRRLYRSFSNYEIESLKLNLIILMKLNRLKIAPFYFIFALPRVASANGVIMYARTRRLHRSFSNYEMESLKLNLIILMKLNRLKIEREKGKKEVLRLGRCLSHSITDAIILALKHRIPS